MRKWPKTTRVRAWLGPWKIVGVELLAKWRPYMHHLKQTPKKVRVVLIRKQDPQLHEQRQLIEYLGPSDYRVGKGLRSYGDSLLEHQR